MANGRSIPESKSITELASELTRMWDIMAEADEQSIAADRA